MIYTEVLPYIYITDIKYLKKTNIQEGTILLLTKIDININKKVNIIRLPLEFTGKYHEYKESITKNKHILANQLTTVVNVILEIHNSQQRKNLYISCPDGLQIAPFVFLAYLVMYGRMSKEEALECLISKNKNFFTSGILYYDILS